MPQRPFLTARWSEILLLNFRVPTDVIAQLAPPGTEPDLHNNQAYISVIGFRFLDTRVLGLPIPGHTRFLEINLRYYVRRIVDGELRRGVVFAREIVPRRAIAVAANWLYHENYITRRMTSEINMSSTELTTGDTIAYAWQSGSRPIHWNTLSARVAGPLHTPPPNSLEAFIVEHYWGYTRNRHGSTHEYRVAHDPWRVAPVSDVVWHCDLAATYHDTPFTEFLASPPASALVADGSPVQVFPGRPLGI